MDKKSNLYIRKRFGRGGRQIIDRHLSRKPEYKIRNLDSPLVFDSRELYENFQKNLEKNRYDNSSDEFNSDPDFIPLEEDLLK
jgi:hypothetical protein